MITNFIIVVSGFIILLVSHWFAFKVGFDTGRKVHEPAEVTMSKPTKNTKTEPHYDGQDPFNASVLD